MKSLGIDLASNPLKTGVCVIEWGKKEAVVEDLWVGAEDESVVSIHEQVDVTGIDAPFGWPVPFVELLNGSSLPSEASWSPEIRDPLRFRSTDFEVRESMGRWPLSVSTDLIAVPALRCLRLLHRMGVVDKSGDGRVYETYPSAALHAWGFRSTGYKGRKKRSVLESIWNDFAQRTPWLRVRDQDHLDLLVTRDDAFDALVAAVVARAAKLGLTTPPSDDVLERARTEGWIHVPEEGSLDQVVNGSP